jgi:hypothetical protein
MPVRRTEGSQSIDIIVDLVLRKYRSDPCGFRQYLPEVAAVLDRANPAVQEPRPPVDLTPREREHRLAELDGILGGLRRGRVSYEKAITALEHCSVLTQDDNLPDKVSRRCIMRLFGIVLGKPLSDVTAETTVKVAGNHLCMVAYRISLVRGAVLNLNQDMHLVSVSVTPKRLRDRARAMRFITMLSSTESSAGPEDEYATP